MNNLSMFANIEERNDGSTGRADIDFEFIIV